MGRISLKIVLFANTDWYLYNFRRSFALTLKGLGYDVLLLSPPGEYGEKLRELGLRWQPIAMDRRSLNPLREAALILRLLRLFQRERPTLIHSFTIKCAVYGSVAARLARVESRVNAVAGMGYVFTSSDLMARILRLPVRMLLRIALGGRGSRLILQNPDDVRLFENAGLVDARQVRLIPGSGVDCSRFALRGHRASGTSVRVLFAARLLWDKGIAEFVAAARQLRGEGRDLRFVLAGSPDEGNPAAVSRGHVQQWVDEGLVQWLGHVDDMPKLLGSVDMVVLPSYREGLPKSLIEAAACGLPLVTTDVPGCREVVTDGVDGLLVPARNAPALARAIAQLADNSILATRLGMAAREKALSQFDEQIVIRRTLETYDEVLRDLSLAGAVATERSTTSVARDGGKSRVRDDHINRLPKSP